MGVRQVRRDSRASSNHRGNWCNGTVQREEAGASVEGEESKRQQGPRREGEDRQRRGEGGEQDEGTPLSTSTALQ